MKANPFFAISASGRASAVKADNALQGVCKTWPNLMTLSLTMRFISVGL